MFDILTDTFDDETVEQCSTKKSRREKDAPLHRRVDRGWFANLKVINALMLAGA